MPTVGEILIAARLATKETPEDILERTGISINYLRELEADRINKPSASVLWKLATHYQIPLRDLLLTAGIILPKQHAQEIRDENNLTPEERMEVLKYLEYLKGLNKQNSK